jgi:hypothetical protein
MKSDFLQVLKKRGLALSLIAASAVASNGVFARGKSVDNNSGKKHNSPRSAHAKDVIMIRNSNGSYGIAKLYLPSGKKCSETVLRRGNNAIDISLLPQGEYIISITLDGGETFNQKFTKA